jgi:hypothetical protein
VLHGRQPVGLVLAAECKIEGGGGRAACRKDGLQYQVTVKQGVDAGELHNCSQEGQRCPLQLRLYARGPQPRLRVESGRGGAVL